MAIANPQTTLSSADLNHHSRMDSTDENMHYPKGFLDSDVGKFGWKDGSKQFVWENLPLLPAALDIKNVMSAAPGSPSNGDIYLLDESGSTYTVSAINWQSGNTVRYTFSGTPDLSSISTSNALICTGATNLEHNGSFLITAVSDISDYIEITNTLISDATLDETTGSTCQLPHADWSGNGNNSWVRYSSADGVWYGFSPIAGQSCYDKVFAGNRTFDGTRWIGEKDLIALAFSDEGSDLTTGVAKITFHMPYKMRITSVVVGVTTAPTGATLNVDLNDDGSSIFSTVVTVDAGEKTSATAATPSVIDSTKAVVEVNSLMTVDIDQVGSTIAGAGGKIYIHGFRA